MLKFIVDLASAIDFTSVSTIGSVIDGYNGNQWSLFGSGSITSNFRGVWIRLGYYGIDVFLLLLLHQWVTLGLYKLIVA